MLRGLVLLFAPEIFEFTVLNNHLGAPRHPPGPGLSSRADGSRALELDADDTIPPESHCLSLTFTTAR